MYSLAADSPAAKGGVDNIQILIKCVGVEIWTVFPLQTLNSCCINKQSRDFKTRARRHLSTNSMFSSFPLHEKKLKTTQSVSWNKCLFDFGLIWGEISLESENTSQHCWKSPPPSLKHTVCCDSYQNHVSNLMVFQGTYENTLQSDTIQYAWHVILTLLIFILANQLLQLLSFLLLHLSLPLFSVILQRNTWRRWHCASSTALIMHVTFIHKGTMPLLVTDKYVYSWM